LCLETVLTNYRGKFNSNSAHSIISVATYTRTGKRSKCLLLLRLTNQWPTTRILPLHLDVAMELPPLEIKSGYAPAWHAIM